MWFVAVNFFLSSYSLILSREDFGIPTISCLLDMAKVLASIICDHQKVAIHCHSGLGRHDWLCSFAFDDVYAGRTGVLIAAHLMFERGFASAEAITFVRQHRRNAIQTRGFDDG